MANNLIQVKRTSVSGRAANSTTLPNPGELALNMSDGILYSTNGSTVFEIGANNTNARVSGTLTVNAVSANGGVGANNQRLTSNGSSAYWKDPLIKDLVDVAANGATDTQVLTYNSTLQKWVNQNPPVANVVYTTGYYGYFSDTDGPQYGAGNNVATVLRLDTPVLTNGVTRTSNNELQVAYAGVYQFIYSIQFENSSSKNENIRVWLRKNGTDVANSGSDFGIYPVSGAANGFLIAVTPLVENASAGDKYQIVWSTADNTAISILSLAATANSPFIPGALVSVTPVSNIITAPPGSNTDVTFNDSGLANGASGLTYNKTTNSVFVANNLNVGNTVNASVFSIGSALQANSTIVNAAALLVRGQATVNQALTVNSTTINSSGIYATNITSNLTGNVLATTVSSTSNITVGANVLITTANLVIGNSTANVYVNSTAHVGNVVATSISGNLTGNVVATNVNVATVQVNTSITIDNNKNLRFQTVNSAAFATFTQQSDDNFVFYSTNTTGGQRAVFNVYANTNSPNQNSALRINVPFDIQANPIFANGSQGTTGQVLTSNGTATYWSTPGVTAVNTSATWTWNNNHTFNANVTMTYAYFANNNGQVNSSSGDFKANAYATLGGGGGNYLAFGQQTNYAQWIQSGYSAVSPVYYPIILNPQGGNIGIGNTNPSHKLRVEGDVSVSGGISVNNSFGTSGQVITSNGTAAYWSTPAPAVNSAAQYAWTNTHSFAANVSITANALGLTSNTSAIYLAGTGDPNWKIGRNTGAIAKWVYSNNTLDLVAANSNLEGVAIGFSGNSYLETGHLGTFVRDRLVVGNSTVNVSVNSTAFIGNVAALNVTAMTVTANIVAQTISGNLTGNVAATTITGNLTGNVAAITITGNLTGNVAATTISGNLTGNVAATTVSASANILVGSNVLITTANLTIGNSTVKVFANSSAFVGDLSGNVTGTHFGNVVATTLSGNLTGNVAATTISGNLTGNVVATTITGNLTGNVAATVITGNLTGNVVATTVNATTINATSSIVVGANVLVNSSTLAIGNSTANVYVNSTAFVGNVVATTISGNLTGNVVAINISGNLIGNVSATTISGNLTAITANVSNKLQIGAPGSFDFGSNAIIEIDANGNTYVQVVVQNANTGNNASADLVVTNDVGNDSVGYVDLGINGSNYNQPGFNITGAGDAYLYASNGHLAIGTASDKEIILHAGGTTSDKRMVTVNSTVIALANSTALVANGSKGTAAQILTSNSTGVYWSSSANNALNLGGVAAASYQLNSTLNANIAAYLPTYAGVVNASTLQVGSNFSANATDVVTSNLTVQGNLIVTGTTVTLNTATLDVKDLNITLAKGTATAAAANGAGITVDAANATLLYINAGNTWLSNINFGVGNSTSNVSVNSTAFIGNVVATAISGNLTGNVSAIAITGNLTGNVAATTITGNLTGNVAAVTITGNLTGNVAATTITGNLTGNVAAIAITGNLTGNVIATTVNATTINATANIVVGSNVLINTSALSIGNSTANVFVNSTAFVGNVVATSISGNLTGNVVATTISASANLTVGSLLIANSTVVNATHLAGVAGASYVQNTDSRTLSGNLVFAGSNTTINAAFRVINSTANVFFAGADGNIGIGTASPGSKLEVNGDIKSNKFAFYNEGSGTATVFTGYGRFVISPSTEAMRIGSDGNVGIGETNPLRKLTVRADNVGSITAAAFYNADTTANNGTVFSFRSDTTGIGATTFQEFAAIAARYDEHNHATRSGSLDFFTTDSGTGAVRMKISPSGNVGIGNTVPTHKLRVDGTTSLAGAVSDITTLAAGNTTITGSINATTINATANIVIGANVLITTANLAIGNSTANVYVNSTAFVGNVVSTTITGNLTGNVIATTVNATTVNATTLQTVSFSANSTLVNAFAVNIQTNTATIGTALYVVSSGNVGIGTSTPASKLHVSGAVYPVSSIERTSTITSEMRSTFVAQHTTTADMIDGFGADISFRIKDSAGVDNEIANVGARRDGADNSGRVAFVTYAAGVGSEKMSIKSNGNVGIGTAVPQAVLDLGAATNGRAITWGSDGAGRYASIFTPYSSSGLVLAGGFHGNTTASDSYVSSYTGTYYNNGIRINTFGAQGIQFFADTNAAKTAGAAFVPTERMRITPTAVIIGNGETNATPTDALIEATDGSGTNIAGASFAIQGGRGTGTAAGGSIILSTSNASGTSGTTLNAITERMRINANGNVGIGTSSPITRLDVRFAANPPLDNGAGGNVLRVYTDINAAADVGGAIGLGGSANSTGAVGSISFGQIAGRKENSTNENYAGYLQFATNSPGGGMSEYMRITSGGNIGLSNTAPTHKLSINGSGFFNGTFGGGSQIYTNTTSTRTKISLYDSSSSYAIGMQSGVTFGGLQDWAMTFQFNNETDRGFWWGHVDHTIAQGAMALTTDGRLTVAKSIRLGFGESDSIDPGTNYTLEVNGSFAATTKSFVIDHPTKPGMKLRYGSLEGPENGVYVRGRSNTDTIVLPDYWTGLVDENSVTVNITPIGKKQSLYVKEANSTIVTIDGDENMDYYFTIFAERKDVEKLTVEF